MSDNKSNGLGLGTILFLIFMSLKLANLITWSWWWVTAPIWIPFASVMVLVIIALMYKK
jgi:hypothetical protein